jgi:hypothetical protein
MRAGCVCGLERERERHMSSVIKEVCGWHNMGL